MKIEVNEKSALWLQERADEQGVEVSTIVQLLIDSYVESCEKEN